MLLNPIGSLFTWILTMTIEPDSFFAVNAGGSIADGTLFNDSWDDNSWDGVWES